MHEQSKSNGEVNGMDYWWKRCKEAEAVLEEISKITHEVGLYKEPTYEAQIAKQYLNKNKR